MSVPTPCPDALRVLIEEATCPATLLAYAAFIERSEFSPHDGADLIHALWLRWHQVIRERTDWLSRLSGKLTDAVPCGGMMN